MKKWINKYAALGIVAFVVFLLVYYWENISGMGSAIMYSMTPLLGGIVIAYIVNIPMSFYENAFFNRFTKSKFFKAVKRPVSMLLAFVTLAALIFAVVVLILPELSDCIDLIFKVVPPFLKDTYLELEAKYEISSFINGNVLKQFEDINGVTDVINKAIEWLFSGFGNVVGSIFSVVSSVFSTVFAVFMSFVFAIYLLLGKEHIFGGFDKLVKAYLKEGVVALLNRIVHVSDESFHRFIVGQCTEALILGVLCIIGMNIFGFHYATMIGTLVGFTALIPIAGAYIGAIIGAIMILATGNWIEALLFIVFIVVLQQLEGNLIYPRVVGASIGLPGIWVLAAITVSGSLGGIPAMLIGVPLFATAYRLVKDNANERLSRNQAVDEATESNDENSPSEEASEEENAPSAE